MRVQDRYTPPVVNALHFGTVVVGSLLKLLGNSRSFQSVSIIINSGCYGSLRCRSSRESLTDGTVTWVLEWQYGHIYLLA